MRRAVVVMALSLGLVTAGTAGTAGPAGAVVYDPYSARISATSVPVGMTVTITGRTAAMGPSPDEAAYPGPGDRLCVFRFIPRPPPSARLGTSPWPGGPGWQQLGSCTVVRPDRSFATTLSIGSSGRGRHTYAMAPVLRDAPGTYLLPENAATSTELVLTGR